MTIPDKRQRQQLPVGITLCIQPYLIQILFTEISFQNPVLLRQKCYFLKST